MATVLMLLAVTLAFCVIAAFLSAVAVGIGFLLMACVPALQLGHAIIAGSVVATASLYFFLRLVNAATNHPDDDEDHAVLVLPKDFLHRRPRRSKPKRKRK